MIKTNSKEKLNNAKEEDLKENYNLTFYVAPFKSLVKNDSSVVKTSYRALQKLIKLVENSVKAKASEGAEATLKDGRIILAESDLTPESIVIRKTVMPQSQIKRLVHPVLEEKRVKPSKKAMLVLGLFAEIEFINLLRGANIFCEHAKRKMLLYSDVKLTEKFFVEKQTDISKY